VRHQGLSATLRVEVLLYLHSDILSKVPLFHDKSKQFMAYLVSFFKLEFYGPGDVIMEVTSPPPPPRHLRHRRFPMLLFSYPLSTFISIFAV
jgi:hypothetical protein